MKWFLLKKRFFENNWLKNEVFNSYIKKITVIEIFRLD
jgi:hypothetical protein